MSGTEVPSAVDSAERHARERDIRVEDVFRPVLSWLESAVRSGS